LIEEAFEELAKRWMPVLEKYDHCGVDLCFEIHPVEDLHDGASFDRFLDLCDEHPRLCINYDPSHFLLQQMDYLQFIDLYEDRIKMFHVKDAEFNPDGTSGVYGGYQDWVDRPGRFRSPGDGDIDFKAIFSKLAQYDFNGWAVVEWECAIKDSEQGAAEGASFVREHMIKPAERSFDDFAGGTPDRAINRKLLGLDE
jgi:sugar phosphate isomerase/epimerase